MSFYSKQPVKLLVNKTHFFFWRVFVKLSHGQTHDLKNWLIVANNVAYAGTSKSFQLTAGTENDT